MARLGEIKVGMRILEVNSVSLLGASHVDAVRALRTAGDNLTMVVSDGYDPILAYGNEDGTEDNCNGNEDEVLYNPARFSPDSASSATSGESYPVSFFS